MRASPHQLIGLSYVTVCVCVTMHIRDPNIHTGSEKVSSLYGHFKYQDLDRRSKALPAVFIMLYVITISCDCNIECN